MRNGSEPEVSTEALHRECARRDPVVRVFRDDLPDSRMQKHRPSEGGAGNGLIPGLRPDQLASALADLLSGAL